MIMQPISGFVIRIAKQSNNNRVKVFGTPADHAGLRLGDQIIQINGVDIDCATHAEVVSYMHQPSTRYWYEVTSSPLNSTNRCAQPPTTSAAASSTTSAIRNLPAPSGRMSYSGSLDLSLDGSDGPTSAAHQLNRLEDYRQKLSQLPQYQRHYQDPRREPIVDGEHLPMGYYENRPNDPPDYYEATNPKNYQNTFGRKGGLRQMAQSPALPSKNYDSHDVPPLVRPAKSPRALPSRSKKTKAVMGPDLFDDPCIQTRQLSLKVKRPVDGPPIPLTVADINTTPSGNRISDAYIVTAEPTQRAHLQQQLKHFHPGVRTVDMMDVVNPSRPEPVSPSGRTRPPTTPPPPPPSDVPLSLPLENSANLDIQGGIWYKNGPQSDQKENIAETSFVNPIPVTAHQGRAASEPPPPQFSTFKGGPPTTIGQLPVIGLQSMPVSYIGTREESSPLDENLPQFDPESYEEQMNRLKKYEDDLRRRKEIRDSRTKEQEFLRTSLRGSKKLQALENVKKPYNSSIEVAGNGHENPAYQIESPSPLGETSGASEFSTDSFTPSDPKPIDIHDIMLSVHRISEALDQIPEHRKDASFLRALFAQQEVQNAAKVSTAVRQRSIRSVPNNLDGFAVSDAVLRILGRHAAMSPQQSTTSSDELCQIIEQPHFQALLYSHDKIAHHVTSHPSTSSNTMVLGAEILGTKETLLDQNDEDVIRIVRLFKEKDCPLGATVRNDDGCVLIGRIVKGGIAEKSGLLNESDEILEVNGISLKGKTVTEVCDIFHKMSGKITFVISHGDGVEMPVDIGTTTVRHMRAFFDYDPEDDIYVPCKELGLGFSRGDILHVIYDPKSRDPNWWQAYRDGEEHPLAGLVPSENFQSMREKWNRELYAEEIKEAALKNAPSSLLCAKKKKPLKADRTIEDPNDILSEDILTYEEVARFLPRAATKRPIVLVGPTNVGCLELRQKLMEADKDRFAGVVPHTSRNRRPGEQDGVHYRFVTRNLFQQDVQEHRFVEWGEYQKHFYGTSLDAIQTVVTKGKICVLTLTAESLKEFRASGLMPYIVFIAPPNIDRLRAHRVKQGAVSVKDEELKAIIQEGKSIEDKYGHLFDKIIVNFELNRTYEELKHAIQKIEIEPQWVPISWVV